MAAKHFEVGDVLPVGTIRVRWVVSINDIANDYGDYLDFDSHTAILYGPNWTDRVIEASTDEFKIKDIRFYVGGGGTIYDIFEDGGFTPPYTDVGGGHDYIDLDITSPITIATVQENIGAIFTWEVLSEPSVGHTISFETNGGTSVSDIEEATELPTPLPTTTKTNNVFVGWYYDEELTQKAYAGDEIEDDVTLYAKWYANMGDFYSDVANAIREKTSSVDDIKPIEFADEILTITDVVELTQAQYDELSVYDDNTYYLIVEEE